MREEGSELVAIHRVRVTERTPRSEVDQLSGRPWAGRGAI